jgi:hypothetical protein
LLRDTLATKAPLLAYNHFVEALFVLNGCTAGLHGARLGANLAGAGGSGHPASGAGDAAAAWVHDGDAAAAAAGRQGQEEGGGGGNDEELSEAWMAAPVQFTLKGKHNRCARRRCILQHVCCVICWGKALVLYVRITRHALVLLLLHVTAAQVQQHAAASSCSVHVL